MKFLQDIFYTEDKTADRSLDIYLPDGDCRAVFLYLHGGGIEAGDKTHLQKEGSYLASRGYAFASINYRMYPQAKFPDFVYDAAAAIAWMKKNMMRLTGCDRLYVGGSSAGGYITMLLCFDVQYLAAFGLSNADIAGYFHDAGQPTAHFNVLKYAGEDARRVIVDARAPLYFIGLQKEYPPMRFVVSDHDMTARYEQTMLVLKTMEHFAYRHFDCVVMNGEHCAYLGKDTEDGGTVGAHLMENFLNQVENI